MILFFFSLIRWRVSDAVAAMVADDVFLFHVFPLLLLFERHEGNDDLHFPANSTPTAR